MRYLRRIRAKGLPVVFVVGLVVSFVAFAAWRVHRSKLDEALISGVVSNKLDAIRIALNGGANPNVRVHSWTERTTFLGRFTSTILNRDHSGYSQPTVLILAADKGSAGAIKLLLDRGADPNLTEGGNGTPLMYASMSDNPECVRLLLAAGARVNAKDKDGVPALQRAAVYCRAGTVKLLIKNGADVNAKANDGGTAIVYAAREGSVDIVRSLIAAGANVNIVDRDGYSALRWAREEKHKEVGALLRRAGAKN